MAAFLNSHCLFSFHEDKPKPKQTRLPILGKFPSTSLKPSKTLKPSTPQNNYSVAEVGVDLSTEVEHP